MMLRVRIVTPKQVIFQDEAYSVSSINSDGKFDILPQHANFITIIENNDIKILDSNKKQFNFRFPLAIIYTTNNSVNIYTDINLTQ